MKNNPNKKTALINDLTTGKVSTKLMTFALPFILANLLQVSYNLIDIVVVGRFVDSAGISAVSNGGEIMYLGTVICVGIASAGQIMIAQMVGNKNLEGVNHAIGTLVSLMGILAITTTVVGFLSLDWVVDAMNVPIEAVLSTKEYCIVYLIGMIFVYGYNTIASILRGMGDSKRPFIIIAVSTVLNLVLDLVLVKGMGVKGAALATVIAQGVSFLGSVIILIIKREVFDFGIKLKHFVLDRSSLKFLLKLGLPLALQYGAVTLSKMFVNSWINTYGVVASAVTSIGTKIGLVASIVTNALGTAAASMIGQSFGAGKPNRINRIIYVSLAWGLSITIPLSILIALFPKQIFGLFTRDPEVITMSIDYVIIAILNFNAFALRSPMMALISGLGDGKLTIVIGIFDAVIARVGVAMLMGLTLKMGIRGFWYGNVIASYVPFIIGGIYFFTGIWKRRMPAINSILNKELITE